MLAVPLHGDDVAPRFCSAHQFLIAELSRDQVRPLHRLTLPEERWSRRLERLSAVGVKVLLCGGFNRSFLPHANGLGIRVISGLAGEAERLIDAFLRDEIERYRFLPCRGRHSECQGAVRPRQRHEGEPRELRRKKGAKPCREPTVPVRRETDRARDGAWGAAVDRPIKRQR